MSLEFSINAAALPGRLQDTAAEEIPCAHCHQTVPPGLLEPNATYQFCCQGCRAVYEIIHDRGLERYYRLRDAAPGEALQARPTGRKYEEFDDAVFQKLYCRALDEKLRTAELFLEGVHCAACVWLVEKLPAVAPGVLEARLDLRRALVRVVWDARKTSPARVARALDSLGYSPHPARDAATRALRKREDRRMLARLAVAGALAGNVMLLAFALYGGRFGGIEAQYAHFFRWLSMILGIVSLGWPGGLFFRGAWAALRTRTAHLDLPIALGLGAGGVAGLMNTMLGRGEIYFDSLTVLVFLLLVGRWIQHRQQRWAADAVELLYSLTPTSVRRVEGDTVREVPIEAIRPGDLVEVRAGDTVPVDGVVAAGASSVDQSWLTGESKPVDVGAGGRICAGTVNLSAVLRVRTEATGETTRVGNLMRLVEQCAERQAPIVRFADRIAGWFTIVVLILAAGTFGVWLWLNPALALDHATALLIVTCPCALGLSTPLVLTVAIGRAAKRGIFIKGGDTLERLARPGLMLLDKTGTLTAGRMALLRWHGDESVKPLVAAVETHSAHPIARAFVKAFAPDGEAELPPATVTQTAAGGIIGEIHGQSIVVGAPAFVQTRIADDMFRAPPLYESWRTALDDILNRALTPVLIAWDGRIAAVAGLGDPLRADAADALRQLRALGWRVGILSGDHAAVTMAVADELGVDRRNCQGGAMPEEKLAVVEREIQSRKNGGAPSHKDAMENASEKTARVSPQSGAVVMVGDGVNDAAALSAADVGIAVHGGAEASLAAADIYLNRPGLTPIVELARAGRQTFRVIRRSFVFSLFYNAIGATLAMTGVLNPLIAAILMPISSFTVLTLAFSARIFENNRTSFSNHAENPRQTNSIKRTENGLGGEPCP